MPFQKAAGAVIFRNTTKHMTLKYSQKGAALIQSMLTKNSIHVYREHHDIPRSRIDIIRSTHTGIVTRLGHGEKSSSQKPNKGKHLKENIIYINTVFFFYYSFVILNVFFFFNKIKIILKKFQKKKKKTNKSKTCYCRHGAHLGILITIIKQIHIQMKNKE